jgi:alkylation response protein AidB-like acyl-CoA dehydrogenase
MPPTDFDPGTSDVMWLLRHVITPGDGPHSGLDLETTEQLLDASAAFIEEKVAPLRRVSDEHGAKLNNGRVSTPPGWRAAWTSWAEDGWAGLGIPEALGGQGTPFLIQAAVATMLGGADLGFAMVSASSRAAAAVLEAHAPEDIRKSCVPKLAAGEWTATIAITEASAGSDVGLIKTSARPLPSGQFELTGTKIFISGADHDLTDQILHLVLARIEGDPPGVKGLSLFLVPALRMSRDGQIRGRNTITVSRVEKKMGLRGSPTCVVNFERAEAFPIGNPGEGLQRLFTMMNELRIEVALSAVGASASATRHALSYADERFQGRGIADGQLALIRTHPDVERMLLTMRCLSEGGRALVLEAAHWLDLLRQSKRAEYRKALAAQIDWLLPICKACLSDNALEITGLGIQVRGGHGYIRDTGAEQFYRDVRVLPIYEGANGIHAGSVATRGLQKDGGAACFEFISTIRKEVARTVDSSSCEAIRSCVGSGLDQFEDISKRMLSANEDRASVRKALEAAYDYITFAGRLAMGWMWLRMACADAAEDTVLASKRTLAKFYARRYSAEMTMYAQRIRTTLGESESRIGSRAEASA